jgi:adenylate cyclase
MAISPTTLTANDELKELRGMVSSVITSLRNQQELLRKRAELKAGNDPIPTLVDFEVELGQLAMRMSSEEIELLQLSALAENAALINSSLDLDTVLKTAMSEIISLTGAERGYIIVKNTQTGAPEFLIAQTQEADTENNGGDITEGVSTTILREVLDTGTIILADNAYKDPRFFNSGTVMRHNLRSVLCVPLRYKGQFITGAVYVDNRLKPGVFGHGEENLLAAFANQVAVAIENARLFAEVQARLVEISSMQELMHNVFESIGSGVITSDGRDTVTTYNHAACDILGKEAQEAIGQPLQSVLPRLGGDFDTYLAAVREKNQSAVTESLIEAERGRKVLNVKVSPLKDSNQAVQGVAVVLDDITEQRELDIIRRYLPPQMVDKIQDIAGLALGGEKRHVTCMFVDVRPLYTFPTGLRPRQIMELLNQHLSLATECIHQAGGVIDKYMGNEIMVLFNTQLNEQTDHALKAVEAALALRESFVEQYAQMGLDPDNHFYRIGIHSGEATLGNVGSKRRLDFTALGDTINLSKRLEENALTGQIILSDDTRQAIGAVPMTICLEERDAIQVKGRTQQTRIYEVFKA